MVGKIKYHELIDDYLANKLPDDLLNKFEIQLMQDTALQESLQLSLAIREGLWAHAALPEAQQPDTTRIKTSVISRHHWFGLLWKNAALVSVSLLTGALLVFALHNTAPNFGGNRVMADVPILTFSRLRSASLDSQYSYVFDASKLNSDIAVLELEVDFPTLPEYRVTIVSQDDSQRQVADVMVQPNQRGYLVMALPATHLTAGDYAIQIVPAGAQVEDGQHADAVATKKLLDYRLRVD